MSRSALIAGCAILLAACTATAPPAPAPPVVGTVEVQTAARLAPAVSYVGTLAGDVEVDLAFKLAGRIDLLGPEPGRDWREGDVVAAGAVLARLDPTALLEAKRAVAARAGNDAALYERGAKLIAEQRISQQDFDQLAATRDASAAELRRAEAALADAVLTAPISGTILRRGARAGETAAVGQAVLRLADLTRMSVELGVPEQVVTRLSPGQELAMTVAAFAGAAITGTVSEVGASASATTRLFRVRIAVANPDGRLKPGMSATVAIPGAAPPPQAVSVPLSALVADAGGRSFHVYTVRDGTARALPVHVVDVFASDAVLAGGVAAGERVVAIGAGLCSDGLRVEARPYDPDALYRRP
jgi:membrane fusion protein (multidrug efflux system)